jgi:hypothetical protein
MSVPGFCCGAFGAVGDDDDEMVFLIGAEAEDADGLQKPHLEVVYPGAVCIAQEELYRKLLDAALASNSPFSNLCRMYDMGFRGTLLVRQLVTCAEEPAFKFSHLKLLVDMGVLVPSPPLASDSDVPRAAAAAAAASGDRLACPRPRWAPRCPMLGLCGLRGPNKHAKPAGGGDNRGADKARLQGDGTWAWASPDPIFGKKCKSFHPGWSFLGVHHSWGLHASPELPIGQEHGDEQPTL